MKLYVVMSLYDNEIADLRKGSFFLDASEIVLTRRDSADDMYRGPGFVRQGKGGNLEYTLYDHQRETSFPSRLSSPGVIPNQCFYDLELVDHTGRHWEAARTLPHTSGVMGKRECVCKGEVYQITCVEHFGHEDNLWMFLPGVFNIPTNAVTSITEERLTQKALRLHYNVWRIENDHFEIVTIKVDGGIEIRVRPRAESLPINLSKCLEEAVWFVLAVPAYAQLIEQTSNGFTKFSIREPRVVPSNITLRPPIEPNHGDSAEYLGDLLLRYLHYVLPRVDETYHPTSVNVLSVLRASAITIESLALALSIAIESIVSREFAEFGLPNRDALNAIDSAIEYVSSWPTEETIKDRIIKAVTNWKGPTAREALKHLTQRGVITQEQLGAWNSVRHPLAHGQKSNKPIEVLLHLCHLQHTALLRLLFQVLEYHGQYTDRSVADSPRSTFQTIALGQR